MDFLVSAPLPLFLAFLAFPLAMTAVCLGVAWTTWRKARRVAGMPTTAIREAKDGFHELEGRLEAIGGRTLRAPVSRRPCVWFEATVDTLGANEKGSREVGWLLVRQVTSESPFLLRDATGVCAVFPNGAQVDAVERTVSFGPTELPSRSPGVIDERARRYRYTERLLVPGETLFAHGSLATIGKAPEDEDEEEDDEPAADAWAVDDPFEELSAGIDRVTRRFLHRGRNRFHLATTPQETFVHVHSIGAQAALWVTLVPAALAAWLVAIRWG